MNPSTTNPTLLIAARMAAAGNYREANALLDTFNTDESPVEVYLLRAKILAQQSRFDAAIAQWQKALAKDPNNSEAQAGLKKAGRLKTNPLRQLALRANLYYAILATIGIGAILLFIIIRPPQPAAISQSPSDSVKVDSSSVLKNDSTALLDSIQSAIQNFDEELLVEKENDKLALKFANGLFTGSDTLLIGKDSLLVRLGSKLRTFAGRITIVVIGYTNDLPIPAGSKYPDNAALRLARAVIVEESLRAATGFSISVFSPKGGEESQTPYPNTPENRHRNRTVIIEISGMKKN